MMLFPAFGGGDEYRYIGSVSETYGLEVQYHRYWSLKAQVLAPKSIGIAMQNQTIQILNS